MAKLGEIDVRGTLNAATVKGIIAKAEQISIKLPYSENGQDYTILSDYIHSNVQFKSAEYITEYVTNTANTLPAFFIATTSFGTFVKGHFYYYLGIPNQYEDLTPEGGGPGGSITGNPILTIQTEFKEEYNVGESLEIAYSWVANGSNTGYGRVYGILDGTTLLSRRELPSNASNDNVTKTWTITNLKRGNHTIEMYVVDSGNNQSLPRFYKEIAVGGLEISILDKTIETNYQIAGQELIIPFEVLNNTEDPYKVYASWDDGEIFLADQTSVTITAAMMTDKTHKLTLQAKTYKEVDGEEVILKESNIYQASIISAKEGAVYVSAHANTAQVGTDPSLCSIEENQQVRFTINIVEIGGSKFKVNYYLIPTNETFDTPIGDSTLLLSNNGNLGLNSTSLVFDQAGKYLLRVSVISDISGLTGTCDFKCSIQQSSLYSLDPIVDNSLKLWLDASGKRNVDDTKETWEDKSGNNVPVYLHDFNYSTNGWVMDEDNVSLDYLLINSRAYVEIDLEPFYDTKFDVENKGLTVDIEFETRDVSNVNARVISCYGEGIGFYANTDTARLGSSASPTEVIYTDKVDAEGNVTTTKTGPFEVNFRQNTKTHLTFSIFKYNASDGDDNVYPISLMTMYVNGVMSGVQELTANDSFRVNKWQKIYLGCNPVETSIDATTGPSTFENFGEAKIYNVRVYDRALSMEEIVTNCIADIKDPVEKDLKVRANKLGQAASDSTLIIPEMTFNMFEADFKNITKDDKQKATVQYNAASGAVTNIDEFGLVQWQGTSTLAYAVKNYRVTFYDKTFLDEVEKQFPDLPEIEKVGKMFSSLSKLGKKKKYNIGNGVKESRFTLKADYMDSAVARNTATAMFIGDMGTEETPAQEFINNARTSIYGFPMRLYINKIPNSASDNGLPIETEGVKESLGIFNFNLDKGATDSLGLYSKEDLYGEIEEDNDAIERFERDYPYFDTLSFEISANSDSSAGAFAVSTYESIITDYEYRFPDEDDVLSTNYYGTFKKTDSDITLTITHKYELDEDGVTIVPTDRISNNLITGTYVKNGNNYSSPSWTLEYVEDNIYKINNYLSYEDKTVKETELYLTFVESSDIEGSDGYVIFTESDGQAYMNCRVHLKRLIDWVKDADDETFYAEFEKHFNLSAVLDYYLLVLCNGMVDNLGKNMMLDSYGPAKTGKRYSTGEYSGEIITYTEEEIAQYDNYIWYPHFYDMDTQLSLDNSGNVRFDTDIEMVQGVFNTSKSLLWTKFSRCFFNEIFNRYQELRTNGTFTVDNFMKYYYDNQISIIPEMDYNKNFYNKYLATADRRAYLFMMHGRQYEYMYKWLEERLYFLDTYFEYGEEYNSQCTVRVEYNEYQTIPVTYNIQTYVPSYVKVIFLNSGTDEGENDMIVRQKVPRGQTVEFTKFINTSTDQETIIYNASNLKDIGDVSVYTPKTVLMGAAKKITKLIVGTDEHPNPNLKELKLENNIYLTELQAENCTALSSSLDISKCKNLEKISLKGSSVSSVQFAPGSPLKEIILPASLTVLKLEDMSILDSITLEGSTKLREIEIINCPKLTGYKKVTIDSNGEESIEIVEGSFTNTILNTYKPTSQLTRISMEVYGYVSNATFLNAAATLANQYPDNFNISGQIRYNGTTIPDMYSYFKVDFPELDVKYPNVNNVSNMFENYKNINLVWSRIEKIGTDDNVTEERKYYWTDLREGEFDPEDYVTYNGIKGRMLDAYDDKDMKALADEIKERLAPFERFTNVSAMFRNMRVFEYLHDDTFDNIDLSDANTQYMFDGCNTLKYIEIPKTIRQLGTYMFGNCYRVLAYIPNQVNQIDYTAFYINNLDLGSHPVLLFESSANRNNEKGIRDARYNISRSTEAPYRALQTETTVIGNTEVEIDYFNKEGKKLIYRIRSKDNSPITEEYLNLNIIDDAVDYSTAFSNPLQVSEFLHGSLCNFTSLKGIALPSFDIKNKSSADDPMDQLMELDCSMARLFKENFILGTDREKIKINEIFVLQSDSSSKKVNRYFLKNTEPKSIYISPEVKVIEDSAFEASKATTIEILGARLNEPMNLQSIGYLAFADSEIESVYIPDTVINIDSEAFARCPNINEIKYSLGMTYIPDGCFRDCAKNRINVENISGFSENITEIKKAAFAGSPNLRLFKQTPSHLDTTGFDCYFICDLSQTKNINYFKSLESIEEHAFRNILNITRLDISKNINLIGAASFQPYYNTDISKITPTNTLINWVDDDYSSLSIGDSAFIYRQLNWLCTTPSMKGQILEKILYIPNVKEIGPNAFTPYLNDNDNCGSKLDFIVTNQTKEYGDKNWSGMVKNHLETVYEYQDSIISTDAKKRSRLLYFIKKDDAVVTRLLPQENGNETTIVFIPESVEYNSKSYNVTEILSEALCYNDGSLSSLKFDKNSKLCRLGNHIFKNTELSEIAVIDTVNDESLRDERGLVQYVPATLVKSFNYEYPIGDNIPFKHTSWFQNYAMISNYNGITEDINDFIYLNDYCLGYHGKIEEKTTVIKPTTKVIYENAFSGLTFESFDLPTSLERISYNAFNGCINIHEFNFKVCESTLKQIDANAFSSCASLNKIEFTSNINYVGTDAFAGCPNLHTIKYADGMTVTAESDPLTPVLNEYDKNNIIHTVIISKTMGSFFAPGNKGHRDFITLTNLKNLTLSAEVQTVALTQITNSEDNPYKDLYDDTWTVPYYALDFNNEILKALYPEAMYEGKPICIPTTSHEFICPRGDYTEDIDLSYIETTFEDSDLIRILLGLSPNVNNTLVVKKVLGTRLQSGLLSSIRLQRPFKLNTKE